MIDKRAFLVSLSAFAATGALAASSNTVTDKYGTRTLIPGKPPIMDFGGGLRIPLDKEALKVLWEGTDRWVTFGAGNDPFWQRANYEAVTAATGMMKLMLLTLAFAPQRLEKVDGCGWRLKSGNPKDFVIGDIDLPGEPVRPVSDNQSGSGEAGGGYTDQIDPAGQTAQALPDSSFIKIHAVTAYQVLKKDVTLEDVRARAQLL